MVIRLTRMSGGEPHQTLTAGTTVRPSQHTDVHITTISNSSSIKRDTSHLLCAISTNSIHIIINGNNNNKSVVDTRLHQVRQARKKTINTSRTTTIKKTGLLLLFLDRPFLLRLPHHLLLSTTDLQPLLLLHLLQRQVQQAVLILLLVLLLRLRQD